MSLLEQINKSKVIKDTKLKRLYDEHNKAVATSTLTGKPLKPSIYYELSEHDHDKILQCLSRRIPLYQIAELLSVTRHHLSEYIKKNLQQAHRDMIEAKLDIAEDKLMENIENNDQHAIEFLLKSQGKNRGYGEKNSMPTTNIPVIQIGRLTINNEPPKKEEVIEIKQ